MSTILFVFISGFLFQYTNTKEFKYVAYLVKKLKYVVIPYILVSIPALLDKILLEGDAIWMTKSYHKSNIFFQTIYMLVTGKHSGPFYFIPMICVMYILAPVFYTMQKRKSFQYTGILIVLLGLFTHHYGYYATLAESLLFFIPVYVFGMWVSRHEKVITQMSSPLLWSLLIIYILILGLEVIEIIPTYRLENFGKFEFWSPQLNWGKAKVIILAILLIRIFYNLRRFDLSILYRLGTYSFGIYFIHIYFINAINIGLRLSGIEITQSPIIFAVYLSVVLSLSTLTVHFIKQLCGNKSRFLIGS